MSCWQVCGPVASLPTLPPTPTIPNTLLPDLGRALNGGTMAAPGTQLQATLSPPPCLGPLYPPRSPSLAGSLNTAPPRDVASAEVGLEQPGCKDAGTGLQATPSPFLSIGRCWWWGGGE